MSINIKNLSTMKTITSFQDLQDRINQIVGDINQTGFDYTNVVFSEEETEILAFEKNGRASNNYVTDWELD